MRVALGVEYSGANYCGWQSQPNKCGVQDALEKAISKIALHDVRVHAAGRTDTGVHGMMQVVHFDTDVQRPEIAWKRGVNAYLPEDVRVLWSKYVNDDFHARFSATERSYQYVLANQSQSPAINWDRVGWYHLPLAERPMQEAIAYLIGEHDFSAFRASECQAKSPVRTMHEASVKQAGQYFIFNFTANAFLQHQVRNMLGALVYIGAGKQEPTTMQTLLQYKDRTKSPPTFSANGLYLTGVKYPDEFELPIPHNPVVFI